MNHDSVVRFLCCRTGVIRILSGIIYTLFCELIEMKIPNKLKALFMVWCKGLKVLASLISFFIVLAILYFPVYWFTEFVGEKIAVPVSIVLYIFLVPLIFYLCSRYLCVMESDTSFPFDCPHCSNKIHISDIKSRGQRWGILLLIYR